MAFPNLRELKSLIAGFGEHNKETKSFTKATLKAKTASSQDPISIHALFTTHKAKMDAMAKDDELLDMIFTEGKKTFKALKSSAAQDGSVTFEGVRMVFSGGVKANEMNPQRFTAVLAVLSWEKRSSNKPTAMQVSLPETGVESFDKGVAYLATPGSNFLLREATKNLNFFP